eukprot:2165834-Rhodomonas_salina.2
MAISVVVTHVTRNVTAQVIVVVRIAVGAPNLSPEVCHGEIKCENAGSHYSLYQKSLHLSLILPGVCLSRYSRSVPRLTFPVIGIDLACLRPQDWPSASVRVT